MKNLILFLLMVIFISSCSTVPFDVKNPYKSTTVEIQELMETDTTCYRVIFIDDNMYIIDNNTKLVKYKARNEGYYNSEILFIIILTFLFTILLVISVINN